MHVVARAPPSGNVSLTHPYPSGSIWPLNSSLSPPNAGFRPSMTPTSSRSVPSNSRHSTACRPGGFGHARVVLLNPYGDFLSAPRVMADVLVNAQDVHGEQGGGSGGAEGAKGGAFTYWFRKRAPGRFVIYRPFVPVPTPGQ